METARPVTVDRAVSMETDPLVIVGRVLIADPVVSTETDQLVIVDRVANMATVRFVAMTAVVILAAIRAASLVVAIVIVHLVEISATVIERLVVNSVIVQPAVMIQDLTHVAATETVLLVAMAQALVAHRAHVVMTVGTVVVVVDRVAKTSHPVDLRTKPNVVVKPCAHVAAVKCVKTANKLRCHVKPRPGLMKAELKMKSAMPPKVPCAVRSHRDALCRRDQKMKTN
jgi:hypothetical protein